MNSDDEISQVFLQHIRIHLFEENWVRLQKCIDLCDADKLWYRTNNQTNSIGNLVLHLHGNLTQWILHGIGGIADVRVRKQEFIPNQQIDKQELMTSFGELMSNIDNVLKTIKADDLLMARKIQGMDTTIMGILIHVTEHFSYHLGQISLIVKQQLNVDLKYYDGMNLDLTSS